MRFIVALGLLLSGALQGQPAPPADTAVELGTIAVTGTQPGPGLWKVSKDDHVLWILGTSAPLPRDIQWRSSEVEARIAQSQQVLTGTEVRIKANTGIFGTLALLPALIGIRNNPDHALLRDVVAPEMYARWEPLKRKYLGRGNRVEKWRPIFAALELYTAALDKNRLTGTDYVRKNVIAAAKRAHVPVTTPSYEFVIDKPRDAIHEFKLDAVDDRECFRLLLDRIDSDLASMTARANAWAAGDIAALRKLPQSDGMAVCSAAISESRLARERGISDLPARVAQAWFDAASSALARNASTVALVPMRQLLAQDGPLARFAAVGCTIEAPDAESADATGPTTAMN